MTSLGRLFILLGIILLISGALLLALDRLGIRSGHLPGDLIIKRGNLTCMFPLATSILLSIGLTVLLNWIGKFLNHK